jgi:hypothetical protein
LPLTGIRDAVDLDMDERFARCLADGIGGEAPQQASGSARRTAMTGCTMRCRVNPCRFTSIVTESTRNGMSSLTISTIVCVD